MRCKRRFLPPCREGGFAQSIPNFLLWSSAWIQVTAGGGRARSTWKAGCSRPGSERQGPRLLPHVPPAARRVLRPPRPAPSHLLLSQGVGVNIHLHQCKWWGWGPCAVQASWAQRLTGGEGVVLQPLTSTRVCASLQVSLLLVYNFSYSPGGKKKCSEHLVFTQNLRGSWRI